MKLDDSTEIKRVVINENEKEIELFEKPNSKRCHFKEPFYYKGYYIQLRLDWGPNSRDKNGEPMLDADIWEIVDNKKKMLERKKRSWHHTPKEFKDNQYVYLFEFQGLKLKIFTKKTIAKTIKSYSVIKSK